jgi:DNA (cytosine-5)-methyltransferase 1
MEVFKQLGYYPDYKILNALHFGLPQKRERVFIGGFCRTTAFLWPDGSIPMKPLKDILEPNPPQKYFASEYIRRKRLSVRKPMEEPTIWHENKSGNIGVYPYSCALRAGASYNYLLVNGERRLTPREMLRLQGFPDSFKIICNYAQTRKQAGNALPVPVAGAVLSEVFKAIGWGKKSIKIRACREEKAKAANC